MDRSVFDAMRDVQRLIDDHRKTMYNLEELLDTCVDDKERALIQKSISDRDITIKALELYLWNLEHSVQSQLRQSKPSRENLPS